ncbi:MAG: hypothetical protein EOO03_16650, partial [Chitinophagaceae bacterium]
MLFWASGFSANCLATIQGSLRCLIFSNNWIRAIIKTYFRTWAVMSHFYRIFSDELSSGVTTQSTLRDLYYTMKPKELFNECTSGQVSKMVSDVATILDCSRDSLKI